MNYLRRLIAERIRMTVIPGNWVLDVYCHLMSLGISPDDAIKAMQSFVDELIEAKTRTERQ